MEYAEGLAIRFPRNMAIKNKSFGLKLFKLKMQNFGID